MKPSQDLGSSCYQFPAPAGRCGGSEAAQRGCAPLQSLRQSLPARPGLPGSLYKFLLCRAGASSPFQAAVTSSCQHLEPPWARNQQELGTGDPSPRPAVWDGQARLLGKPSLNREHPLQTPPALPGTNPALQGPQTTPKPPPCPQPALLKGWQHFLSAPSQKQNTQHWQPLGQLCHQTTAFPAVCRPGVPLGRAAAPGLWARPKAALAQPLCDSTEPQLGFSIWIRQSCD